MNTTYQQIPRSRSTKCPQPEHPNTAYRPSHISMISGMVAQHGRAFPRDIKKDHLVFDAGSNPAHPIHVNEYSSGRHPSTPELPITPQRGASYSMTTTVKKQHSTTQKITEEENTRDMAKTSIQAFKEKKRRGTLKTDKQKVHYLIKEYGPVTSLELQMWMNKPKHKFTGRITQLQDEGKIHATGTKNGHEQYEVKQ